MKKLISILVFAAAFILIAGMSSGSEIVTFGPKTYTCTKPLVYFSDSFTTFPGPATLTIRNGSENYKDRVLFASIDLNGKRVAPFLLHAGATTTAVRLENVNTLSIRLLGTAGSFITITITQNIQAPTVSISADPLSIQKGESSTLSWDTTYSDYCVIEPGIGTVVPAGSCTVSPAGTTAYHISAVGRGGTASSSVTVEVTKPAYDPPTVDLSPPKAAITKGESVTLSWTSEGALNVYIDNGVGPVPANGSRTVTPEHTTIYTLTVSGGTGSASATAEISVIGMPVLPPEGSFGQKYEDLIPADATVDHYDTKRFSLITGLVRSQDSLPIQDVSITIHDHPEFGTARTDQEGRFSIPVEGGGTITAEYRKEGFISAQRACYVPWNDIAVIETVTMIEKDTQSTVVTFDDNPATVTVHGSTPTTDEFGDRSCSIVFTGDNGAILVGEDGKDIHELSTINVRATEFSTDASMPAKLPPNSAYTYCVELGVDGAERVRFEKPAIIWVDNFLGFEVGEVVPVGYYDRDRGVWVPSDNGVVVKLLDMNSDGIVDALDASNDGNPDDLNNNGSYTDEVAGLQDSDRYQPNATFWRVEISHFTPCDLNWPSGTSPDAISPNPEGVPDTDQQKKEARDCISEISSSVEERSRIFHEDIPVPGTDMTLHYASNRVEGYKTEITVPASGNQVPSSLKRIDVSLTVAGRTFTQTVEPLPMQSVAFEWDGLDYLGRPVDGSANAHIEVGFVYDRFYFASRRDLARAFAQAGTEPLNAIARTETALWKRDNVIIHRGSDSIAEGWTLSLHHQMNPTTTSVILKGDGSISESNIIVETVAGNGEYGYSGDGGPAVDAKLSWTHGIACDKEGNLYIADTENHRIRKVDTDGIITTVAGTGDWGFKGDGGPAINAKINYPVDVAIDAEGNLYIADYGNERVRKVDTDGIITTMAGCGSGYNFNDGIPAIEADFSYGPWGIAVDVNGNLYITEIVGNCVRKVDTMGTITIVAGDRQKGYGGDGGPAIDAHLYWPHDVAVDTSGNLYIADLLNQRIRKVDTAGIITTVAGNGRSGFSGDGGPAIEARFSHPYGIAADSAGNLYIADDLNRRIRKVDTTGTITTIAGNGQPRGYGGDGGPATLATLNSPVFFTQVDTQGNLYISDGQNFRIRKVGVPAIFAKYSTGGDIPFFDEGGHGYIMSYSGQHKRTIDVATGITLYEFGYDDGNNLISITDRFGNITELQRDGNGEPTAIVSPDGLVTTLTIDSSNHLTRITHPDGASYNFAYTTDGLLTVKTEPEGNRYEHTFDAKGRLTDAMDEEGGHWRYSRNDYANGDFETGVVSGEGTLTMYLDHTYSTNAYTSTITDPTGGITLYSSSANGLSITKSLPCGMNLAFTNTVDPEYKYEYVQSIEETSPAGLKHTTFNQKTYQDTDDDTVPDLITETLTANGKTITYEHDVFLAQKTLRTPEGRMTGYFYHPETLLVDQTYIPGLNSSSYNYDSRGRLISVETGTRRTTYTYDSRGFLASIINPKHFTTTYEYDPVGRVVAIHRPDGRSMEFTYDGNGNMTALTTPSGIDHVFDYNRVNKNDAYQTPLSGSYYYFYDKDRRLIKVKFPSGAEINYIYNATQLSQIETPEGTIDYTYLCGTKVGSVANAIETISYDYDGTLVTSEVFSSALNNTLSYTYNNDFHVTDFSYAGNTEQYAYDNDELQTGAGRFSISRNPGNGLPESVSDGTHIVARTFNDYGEVESESHIIAGQPSTSWSVHRDDTGRITEKAETAGGVTTTSSYAYDPMGRLLAVTKDGILVEEYRYSAGGARTYEMNSLKGISDRNFAYSDEDHLLTADNATYQYNADGYLITCITTEGTTDYDYSTRGELLAVTLPDARIIEYLHDPLGRRIAKKVNGVITEKYLWQGLTALLAVYDGSDTLLIRFEYADDRMPLAMTRGGSIYYLIYDQAGSLRTVNDASGNVVRHIDYDSFGNTIADTNPTFHVPFGFAGGLYDPDTGLIRFGYRDYDPDIGRWTAKDSILFAGGDTDLYGYCVNDPVNGVDPFGLFCELCTRDFYPWFIVPAKHCYIRFNGDKDDTLSFDLKGVHHDPAPDWWFGQSCSATTGEQDDECVRSEMKKCSEQKWTLTGFNCGHCAEQALKACGQSSSNGWPNWPVNPGPQPGEKGYKP